MSPLARTIHSVVKVRVALGRAQVQPEDQPDASADVSQHFLLVLWCASMDRVGVWIRVRISKISLLLNRCSDNVMSDVLLS